MIKNGNRRKFLLIAFAILLTLVLGLGLFACKGKKFNVFFVKDKETVKTVIVKKGESVEKSDIPTVTKEEHTFDGWLLDDKITNPLEVKIEKETTFKAKFTKKAETVETFSLTLPSEVSIVSPSVLDVTKVAKDTKVTVKVNIPANKEIETFKVNDVAKTLTAENTLEITITANTKVTVTFKDKAATPTTHKLTLTGSGLSLEDTSLNENAIEAGSSVVVLVSFNADTHKIKTLTVDGIDKKAELSADNKLTVKVEKDTVVVLELEEKPATPTTHKLTLTGSGLSLEDTSLNENAIEAGSSVVVLVSFNADTHKIKTLTVDGIDKKAELSADNKLTVEVNADTVVVLELEEISSTEEKFSVTIEPDYISMITLDDKGGTLDFAGVAEGTKVEFTVHNVTEGKYVNQVLVNGFPVAFDNVTNKGSFEIYENSKIKLDLKDIMLKVNYSGTGLTSPTIISGNAVKWGASVTFNIVKAPAGHKIVFKINDADVEPTADGENFKHVLVVKEEINAVLSYEELPVIPVALTLAAGTELNWITYDAAIFTNLSEITPGAEFKFKLNEANFPAGHELVRVLVETTEISAVSGEYTIVMDADKELKIELKEVKYELNYSGEGLTCDAHLTGAQILKGTEITLKVAKKTDYKAFLKKDGVDVTLVDKTTHFEYVFNMNDNHTFVLTYVSEINITVEATSQAYIVFEDPNLDVAQVNVVAKGYLLQFRVNIPVGKKITKLIVGTNELTTSIDSTYVYETVVNSSVEIKVTFEATRHMVTPTFTPETSKANVNIHVKEQVGKIETAQEFEYNTVIVIEADGALGTGEELTVKVNETVVTLPHELIVQANVNIEVIVELTSAKVYFEFGTEEQLFDAGLFGANVENYSSKMAAFPTTLESALTLNKGETLTYNGYFLDRANFTRVFDGFKIKGTDVVVRNGDVFPLIAGQIVLVPNYKSGLYRTDLDANIYYIYEVVSASEMELVQIGNLKDQATKQPKNMPASQKLLIHAYEIVKTSADPAGVTYTIVGIADNATENLKHVVTVDAYISNNGNIKYIGANNFNNLSMLENFWLSTKITRIGANTLKNNSALKLEIHNGVKYLQIDTHPDHKYLVAVGAENPNATTITLHDNAKIILSEAFKGMTSLTTVVLNDELKQIGIGAFENCSQLANVNFADLFEILYVESKAFTGTLITTTMLEAIDNPKCVIAEDAV